MSKYMSTVLICQTSKTDMSSGVCPYDCLHAAGNLATCLGKSVQHDKVPPCPGFTRVDNNIGHLLQPNRANPDHTDLVFVAQADLKGWIPGWAVSNASGVQRDMVLLVKEHFAPKMGASEIRKLTEESKEWMICMEGSA